MNNIDYAKQTIEVQIKLRELDLKERELEIREKEYELEKHKLSGNNKETNLINIANELEKLKINDFDTLLNHQENKEQKFMWADSRDSDSSDNNDENYNNDFPEISTKSTPTIEVVKQSNTIKVIKQSNTIEIPPKPPPLEIPQIPENNEENEECENNEDNEDNEDNYYKQIDYTKSCYVCGDDKENKNKPLCNECNEKNYCGFNYRCNKDNCNRNHICYNFNCFKTITYNTNQEWYNKYCSECFNSKNY